MQAVASLLLHVGDKKGGSPMRPILRPERARARRADWAPGPGVFVLLPPVALILTWRAVMPSSCTSRWAVRPVPLAGCYHWQAAAHRSQCSENAAWVQGQRTLHLTAASWAASMAA